MDIVAPASLTASLESVLAEVSPTVAPPAKFTALSSGVCAQVAKVVELPAIRAATSGTLAIYWTPIPQAPIMEWGNLNVG